MSLADAPTRAVADGIPDTEHGIGRRPSHLKEELVAGSRHVFAPAASCCGDHALGGPFDGEGLWPARSTPLVMGAFRRKLTRRVIERMNYAMRGAQKSAR